MKHKYYLYCYEVRRSSTENSKVVQLLRLSKRSCTLKYMMKFIVYCERKNKFIPYLDFIISKPSFQVSRRQLKPIEKYVTPQERLMKAIRETDTKELLKKTSGPPERTNVVRKYFHHLSRSTFPVLMWEKLTKDLG